ncbi:MAG: hypothetical protein WCG21_03060 [Eubacteriales bacterium]
MTQTSETADVMKLSDFYGNYAFKEVSVLSMLSSSTINYANEQRSGNTYTVTEDLFEIRGKDFTFTVEKPKYEAFGMPGDNDIMNRDGKNFAKAYLIDAQYRILKENGDPAYYKIYTSSKYPGRIWLADYNDNTADGTEILVQSIDMLVRSALYPPDTAQMNKHITGSKEGVDALFELIDDKKQDMDSINYGYEFSYDTVYNITPPDVADGMDCQIFKCSTSCLSILVYNGGIYELGISFGGYGVVDMLLYDYTGDGVPELLYTYSWGSGIHRSCAAYFDFTVNMSVPLDYTAGEKEMMLVGNENGGISLYEATLTCDSDKTCFTDFSLHADAYLTEVERM